jgi:hypothetical protein
MIFFTWSRIFYFSRALSVLSASFGLFVHNSILVEVDLILISGIFVFAEKNKIFITIEFVDFIDL